MASAKMQHWALTLSAYDYKILYVPGKDNTNADVFSCLPLPVQPKEVPMPKEQVLLLESLEILIVTVTQIKHWTDHDAVLTTVCQFVCNGWHKSVRSELQPFH